MAELSRAAKLDQYAGRSLQLIANERIKQLKKGYLPGHDEAEHDVPTLARVAVCYMDFATGQIEGVTQDSPHAFWPETTIPWELEDEPWQTFAKGIAFAAAAMDLAIALAHVDDPQED
jgi:hypothetical protein